MEASACIPQRVHRPALRYYPTFYNADLFQEDSCWKLAAVEGNELQSERITINWCYDSEQFSMEQLKEN